MSSFTFQEVCTLYLAATVNGDQMNLVNGIGLIVCLLGITLHVVLKAVYRKFVVRHCFRFQPSRDPLNDRFFYPMSAFLLCPRHKMARGQLVFALSVLPSFHPIKVCLLNSSYILAWIWMKLGRDIAPQVQKCMWGDNSCSTNFCRVMALDT